MFNKIDKNFFIGSLVVHIVLVGLMLCCNSNNKINKLFVVYGAHSKKPTNTFFKSSKQSTKTNWNQGKNTGNSSTSKLQNSNKKLAQNSSTKNISKKGSSPIKETKGKANKKASSKKIQSTRSPKNKNLKKQKSKFPELKENNKKQTKTKEKAKIKDQIKKKDLPKKPEQEKEPEKTKEKIKKEDTPEKKELKKQSELEQSEETQESKEADKAEQTTSQEAEEAEELHFNLMGEQDPNLAIYQKHIQKEVERLWHPPIGVQKGTECTLSFLIDSSGNIEKYEVIKKSNVLIYDLSILRIAKNFKFDQSLWNKKFTIEFRQ